MLLEEDILIIIRNSHFDCPRQVENFKFVFSHSGKKLNNFFVNSVPAYCVINARTPKIFNLGYEIPLSNLLLAELSLESQDLIVSHYFI